MSSYSFAGLSQLSARVLTAAGSDPGEAAVVADNLVRANLRGIDSHGVIRLPVYHRRLTAGFINSPCQPQVIREAPATALLDGGNGWGAVVGKAGMELAIAKARACGVGTVTAINSNHFGYAAYFGELALPEGMIGIALTNANALMVPTGGRDPFLGTNPICIAIPAGEEPPFVYDGATTVVARGKIMVSEKKGEKIPLDWAVDADGVPTDDPARAVWLSPMAGYKGYDLSVAIDVLSGLLGGGPFGPHIGVLGTARGPQEVGHFFTAIQVEAFRDPPDFKREMDQMLRELRAVRPAAGPEAAQGVLVAGDPERLVMAQRQLEGIPVPDEIEQELATLAAEYGIAMPEPLV